MHAFQSMNINAVTLPFLTLGVFLAAHIVDIRCMLELEFDSMVMHVLWLMLVFFFRSMMQMIHVIESRLTRIHSM